MAVVDRWSLTQVLLYLKLDMIANFAFLQRSKKSCSCFFQVLDALPTAPITLRVIAEEMDGNVAKDRTNVEVALLVEDVVNRKPKFLKNQ